MPSFPSLWDFGLAGSYACFVKVTKAGLSSWMQQSHGILKPALHSPPPNPPALTPWSSSSSAKELFILIHDFRGAQSMMEEKEGVEPMVVGV